ncbi:cortical protein marker for cell polarity-domain-containing protein [Hysterangium stoloniferum]|nr:cortical protein marker for cell polarity-domain-containing protein [Hysterangium stoloniferum]
MTSRKQSTHQLPRNLFLVSFLIWINVAFAALVEVDFDRMGIVGLAGSFAGFDFSDNATFSFDQSTATFLSRTTDGSISPIASTNSGGRIVAGCTLANTFYFAGSFTSIGGTNASNIASYTLSTGSFAALAGGLDGEVDALYCDQSGGNLWAGGAFRAPISASDSQGFKGGVAVYNVKQNSWSTAPFSGLAGATARVRSITSNPAGSSLYFAGSFLTAFQSNTPQVTGTNNPNVPFSIGATPFSSSLVPIALTSTGTEINSSPSNSRPEFANITNALCPAGADGPNNTWLAQDGSTAVITVRTFEFSTASGLRLGNTFVEGRGTTAFSVLTIPDNQPLTFNYVDPITLSNKSCSESCPLGTDPSVLYQDFLFNGVPQSLTGVQITLTQWKGAGSGLHILQLLSSGAFASAVQSQNLASCFSPAASTSTLSGDWVPEQVSTSIAGTTQPILVASVNVGTPSSSSPSVTWLPYVSASGNYDINLLIPGCTNMQDCAFRTSVKVTINPGGGLPPVITTVRQDVTADATTGIYRGPIYPVGADLQTTITMELADSPFGTGQDGKFQLVADRVQLVLTSVNLTGATGSSFNGSTSSTAGAQTGFGFYEWNLNEKTTVDATGVIPNSTETPTDALGLQLFSALGNDTAADTKFIINAVATHSSGAIFVAGNFTLASGPANIVVFKDNNLVGLPNGGLNGPVNALSVIGDSLFVGGVFSDTASASSNGAFRGIVHYNVTSNTWDALLAGVNGAVTSINIANGKVDVTGSFTLLPTTPNSTTGASADGFATWNISGENWVNSGGFLQGSMSFVANGTGAASEFLAGSVSASRQFGGDGFAVLSNPKGNDDHPVVTPLSAQLDLGGGSTLTQQRRSLQTSPWFARRELVDLVSRQASGQPSALPASPVASAPSVLTGAFWTNTSSSAQTIVLGGNFSFTLGSVNFQNLAFYDPKQTSINGARGAQVNGTVRALEVSDNTLFVGGQFTLSGVQSSGLAIYDLKQQQWDTSFQGLQGSTVVIRSITSPPFKANTVVVAGNFTSAGTLPCQGICQFDTSLKQWAQLGSGIQGDVSTVLYTSNPDLLIAAGSIRLSDGTSANVAAYSFTNSTWSAVGQGTQIPGPVTACEVDNGNFSSIFAAGSSSDGSTPFLTFWNGLTWKTLDSTLQPATSISQLAMVPLRDTHAANGIIEPDRMLLISGTLESNAFGNASSALFDGSAFYPFLVASSSTGGPGFVSQIFHSFSSFSFSQRHFLPIGVVILISVAMATGIVFLLLLIGILWTLFSRRDHDGMAGKYESAEYDDDSLHRPSSLLAHINAATRGAIVGVGLESPYGDHKKNDLHSPTTEGYDNTPYIRSTDTPIDAAPGTLMAGEGDEIAREVHVRYSFEGGGEGELPVSAGTQVTVLDDRDPAWWYARDPNTGREGVIPASYLY